MMETSQPYDWLSKLHETLNTHRFMDPTAAKTPVTWCYLVPPMFKNDSTPLNYAAVCKLTRKGGSGRECAASFELYIPTWILQAADRIWRLGLQQPAILCHWQENQTATDHSVWQDYCKRHADGLKAELEWAQIQRHKHPFVKWLCRVRFETWMTGVCQLVGPSLGSLKTFMKPEDLSHARHLPKRLKVGLTLTQYKQLFTVSQYACRWGGVVTFDFEGEALDETIRLLLIATRDTSREQSKQFSTDDRTTLTHKLKLPDCIKILKTLLPVNHIMP